jgi:retron-type reverse transcriptase
VQLRRPTRPYGFRPGRSQHQALDALYTGLLTRKVNWVLDLDIQRFFDGLSHEWLVKFVEHRIADRRVVRLIQKWLNAGVLEEGKRIRVEEGTPQGGSASPLLANVYLHYVSTCGSKRGVRSGRTAMSSWCVSRTISWLDLTAKRMPSSFEWNSRNE